MMTIEIRCLVCEISRRQRWIVAVGWQQRRRHWSTASKIMMTTRTTMMMEFLFYAQRYRRIII